MNVSFINIDHEASNKELFTAIYQNSIYKLNYNNLAIMLQHMYGVDSKTKIKHQNYTLILSRIDSPLSHMVEDNISEYVDVILDSCEKRIDDNEDTTITLLNNTAVAVEQKERYIDYITRTWINVNKVDKKLRNKIS